MFREIGDAEGIAWSLISLAAVARHEGHAGRAAALLADSLKAAEQIGFREGIAWTLELQGLLAADRGDPSAADLLLRSLQLHRAGGRPGRAAASSPLPHPGHSPSGRSARPRCTAATRR
jgi:hypothetical protein